MYQLNLISRASLSTVRIKTDSFTWLFESLHILATNYSSLFHLLPVLPNHVLLLQSCSWTCLSLLGPLVTAAPILKSPTFSPGVVFGSSHLHTSCSLLSLLNDVLGRLRHGGPSERRARWNVWMVQVADICLRVLTSSCHMHPGELRPPGWG